jgi:hypothetical protein
MPKQPARSAVSPRAIESFKRLQEQIEAAEKFLRKLPGARTPEASVLLNDIFPIGGTNDLGSYLRLDGTPGELRVCHHFFDNQEGEEDYTTERLVDFPTVTRIEIAKKIPDLIQIAKASEGKVVKAADEAALIIEQAISEHLEQ